ncbi:MAG: hypothetical protein ICV76_07440 [Nitrospiraceae bacterium]|nr:hypothetical protein [Nitrospiraceae bacterium]
MSNSQVGSYAYLPSGANVRQHAVSTAGANGYTYDATATDRHDGRTLSYDVENRPTSITQGMTTSQNPR